MNPRLTPEQQAKTAEKDKALKARQQALKSAYSEVFGSSAGKKVLRDIFEMSGFDRSDIVADPASGKIFTETTLYNQAWRNFYLRIRARVRPDILKDVEFNATPKDEDIFA